jgi:hypothetical protein
LRAPPPPAQEDSPKPSSERLSLLDDEGDKAVWVYSYGGYATEANILSNGFDFMHSLRDDGKDVDEAEFWFASYDRPTRILGRHNEIWARARRARGSAHARPPVAANVAARGAVWLRMRPRACAPRARPPRAGGAQMVCLAAA